MSCVLVSLAAFSQGTMFVWNSFSLPEIEAESQQPGNFTPSLTSSPASHTSSFLASAHRLTVETLTSPAGL